MLQGHCYQGKTCEELELLSIKRELLVNSVSDVKGLTKDAILQKHNDVFTRLGYIGNYNIELTEEASPKQDAPENRTHCTERQSQK